MALRCSLALALSIAPLAMGCGSLATSPEWVGGGLAVAAPERAAAEESKAEAKRQLIASQPKIISARHLLVTYAGSAGDSGATRSREEAQQRAQKALLEVRGGKPFEDVVREYTEEPGGAERGGLLDPFPRDRVVEPFADAAFALKVNQVSEVVETKFGFHVIKRVELPAGMGAPGLGIPNAPNPAGIDVPPPLH